MENVIQSLDSNPPLQSNNNSLNIPPVNSQPNIMQPTFPEQKNSALKKIIIIACSILGGLVLLFFGYSYIFRAQFSTEKISKKDNPYPNSMTIPFMQSCTIGEKNCQCVLNYLQENYTYEEFSKDAEHGDPLLMEAAGYCKSLTTP